MTNEGERVLAAKIKALTPDKISEMETVALESGREPDLPLP